VEERVYQSDAPNGVFSDPRVSFHKGDITDRHALNKAMRGCHMVFHACGDTRWWNVIEAEQFETNVTGTINALELAIQNSTVTRFVYTSTVDVMGTADGRQMSEDEYELPVGQQSGQTYRRPFDYHYAVTKTKAEKFVLRHALDREITESRGLRITIIRPGSMLGPWDVTDQYGRLFKELKHRAMLGVPCGGTSVCHVQDVARAHVTAAFAPQLQHEVYVCAGRNMTYQRLFRAMRWQLDSYRNSDNDAADASARLGMCCAPCEVIPQWMLVTYGWGCELYSNWISGKEPEVNPGMARYLSQFGYYLSHRAEEELNYPSQSSQRWEDAIAASYNWYRVRGRF
jgi:dihydroflavonol-4-reductase